MLSDERRTLGEQQAAVVRALAGISPAPDAFDQRQLQNATTSLAQKRARAAGKVWPDLRAAIGDEFDVLFAEFARRNPSPDSRGSAADAFQFATDLYNQGKLSIAGCRTWLAIKLHYYCTAAGVIRRRGFGCVYSYHPESQQVLFGLRFWSSRYWQFSWPFWRREQTAINRVLDADKSARGQRRQRASSQQFRESDRT